jgi:hypothetical protein
MGDLDALATSMAAVGLLHPVVITGDKKLIAGHRRLLAARQLGWTEVPVHVIDLGDVLQAEHDENVLRKDFTLSERAAIADAIAARIGNRRGQRTDLPPEDGDAPEPARGELPGHGREVQSGQETAEVAARKAGFQSEREYRRTAAVVANGCPELVEAMDSGKVSVSAAADVATLPREEQRQVLSQGPAAAAEKAKKIREKRPRPRNGAKGKGRVAGRGRRRRIDRNAILGAVEELQRLVDEQQVDRNGAIVVAGLRAAEQRRLVKKGAEAVKAKAKEMNWRRSYSISIFCWRFDPGMDGIPSSARQEVLTELEKHRATLDGWIAVLHEKLQDGAPGVQEQAAPAVEAHSHQEAGAGPVQPGLFDQADQEAGKPDRGEV